ncbi:MAG: ABC transporter ATP-binding protein [Verrucomicrobiales bacterium]|nr:ABC transporter ATP-binding protein [Verrucomicrobiales bacterium]MCP5557367.1 ABC transporter ATP-binding protein [Verrucomicrobiaceae bacterium]
MKHLSSPVTDSTSEVLIQQIPDALTIAVEQAGLHADDVLFSLPADVTQDGKPRAGWLVVTAESLHVFDEAESHPAAVFHLRDADKVRLLQTVGSAFVQLRIDEIYVDVVRLSNGLREIYGRGVAQIRRLLAGEPFQPDALRSRSETICSDCNLPLPAPKAPCPRCAKKGGIFKRTFMLMRPYWSSILLLLAVMVGGVCLDLVPPLLTRKLVDEVIVPHTNIGWLPWILGGLVVASAGRMLLNVVIGRTSSFVGTRITKELRERVQTKLLGLNVDYYNRHSAGSLMSRVLNDVDYFQGFVSQMAQGFLLNVLLVLGIGATLFVMNWQLALWVMIPIPFVLIGTAVYWKVIYPRYYRVWDSQSKMAQSLTGLLQGIRLVKAFGQEDREKKRFAKAAGYVQSAKRSLEMSAATFNPIMGFVFGLGGLIVWNAGGRDVLADKISLGTLMAFFALLGMFYSPVQALSMFSSWLTGFVAAGQRVFEVLDSTSQLDEPAESRRLMNLQGRVELRDVTFGYDPYTPVLKNVSLTIEPGQFVGIVGKSGSGKTTLVNLICRFYDPQEGAVLIDGEDVRELGTDALRENIGLVLQEPFMFRATIAENIAYGKPDADPLSIIQAARAANAHDFIAKKVAGYDTKLGENGAGLSGGEKQRMSIARALLTDPAILIMDEATSAVDTESEQEIQRALAHACKGRTTIAIAHRLSTLKNADIIYVMDEGRVAESGSHDELMERDGIYARLVKIQTQLTRLEAA